MPGNLTDLIENNVQNNNRLLNLSKQKIRNQKWFEFNLKKKFKKCALYSAMVSVLALGVYGGYQCSEEYKSYVDSREKKIVYYQTKFDSVKYHYNKNEYMQADDLSEKLQDELGKEWFFSPTKELYEDVKKFDNGFIDPKIKSIRREKIYRSLKALPSQTFNKIKNKADYLYYDLADRWDYATANEKSAVLFGGIISFALICRALSKKKKS